MAQVQYPVICTTQYFKRLFPGRSLYVNPFWVSIAETCSISLNGAAQLVGIEEESLCATPDRQRWKQKIHQRPEDLDIVSQRPGRWLGPSGGMRKKLLFTPTTCPRVKSPNYWGFCVTGVIIPSHMCFTIKWFKAIYCLRCYSKQLEAKIIFIMGITQP